MNRRINFGLMAAVVGAAGFLCTGSVVGQNDVGGSSGSGGDKAPAFKQAAHADTQFAHELMQLYQPDLIKAEEVASKGTASENMWKAEGIMATWEDIAKNGDSIPETANYLGAMNAYLGANPEGVDGVWMLDHAKFIFGAFSQRVLVRMESYGNSAKDRAALAPMAALGDTLLKRSSAALEGAVHYFENKMPFDENAYMRAFNSVSELEYYNAWGQYFKAMAMEPGTKARKDILLAGAETLGKWADDTSDNGVNKQALLLRGKIRSEAGKLTDATEDFVKASEAPAPDWVSYQARYQIVVTKIRAQDFATAFSKFEDFKKTLPANNKVAMASAEMLRYRITWAEAETKTGQDQKEEQLKALGILSEIIKLEPEFRNIVFEQLGSQIPDKPNMAELLPMQQLAIAYSKSEGQKGETAESQAKLKEAVTAAVAVKENKNSSTADKVEATYLAGICSAVLKDTVQAVKFNVEFAQMAPKDERAKKVLEIALAQIGELRQTPLKDRPDVKALMEQALAISTGTFGDPRFLFALGVMDKENGKLEEAAQTFERIPPSDPKYIDARYQLVSIATIKFEKLTAAKAADSDIQSAATQLFNTCGLFISLLDHPGKLPPESVNNLKVFRTDILMVEASTALRPAVKRADKAKEYLDQLDKVRSTLPALQQGAILRFRIEQLQMSGGSADEIMNVVREYAKTAGQDPVDVMKGMASSTIEEIRKVEKTDPAQAKYLADFVVKLFDPIIEEKSATDKKAAFELREVKADMMVRAGDFKGAQDLCKQLETEEPDRLPAYMTEARAVYVQAQDTKDPQEYKIALDYFMRILQKLTPGGDAYWEAWLRIIECKYALKGDAAADEIKKTLQDLKGSTSHLGGDTYKEDFDRLLLKYGL